MTYKLRKESCIDLLVSYFYMNTNINIKKGNNINGVAAVHDKTVLTEWQGLIRDWQPEEVLFCQFTGAACTLHTAHDAGDGI